ncbi:MAG TPA: hypothetical protein VNO70_03960, partial [Blastocatellia bacterium]|nr:hypothetical protein [Blastocatellia bacterium]
MPEREQTDIAAFIRALPDPDAARVFLDRLESLPAVDPSLFRRNPVLLSRLLLLAAYSPFLAETLLRHPEHIAWLRRETERDFGRVKSTEELSEELARFVVRIGTADPRSQLAQFKNREYLRIYLRDCLGVATLSEVTEELSNLADVILGYALALAHQEMTNLHGAPQFRDERGRIQQAEMAVVALGKLGCRELNYASDIDLLFLYSGAGETAGDGRRPDTSISNRDFFKGVAERVVRMVGSGAGEGAVYRIDLRLRPYGRDGDLVWEVGRAAEYYRNKAHNWERQALIRARASAGSQQVMAHFLDLVRDVVFRPETLPEAVADVRKAKEMIDRRVAERAGGFNVKLGRGGIREIEFIAQALQLAHGGREPWVRSAQTLIVLARLAEKGYLSEAERARLSASYTFLRTVEHRLQMEHGAQTHTLPLGRERLATLARRCGYSQYADPAEAFQRDLQAHTAAVRGIYNRVFRQGQDAGASPRKAHTAAPRLDEEIERLIQRAAAPIERLIADTAAPIPHPSGALETLIASALEDSINPARSLRNLALWAESLATYSREHHGQIARLISGDNLKILMGCLVPVLCSQHISNMLIARPLLALTLVEKRPPGEARDFLSRLRSAIAPETDSAAKTDALRRTWYQLALEIGCRDVVGANASRGAEKQGGREAQERLRANNLEQTALAEASLQLATEIALGSLGVEETPAAALPFAVMGLGRLGHAGMDYGSDLDLLVVFDDEAQWPRDAALQGYSSPQEFYAKLTAALV